MSVRILCIYVYIHLYLQICFKKSLVPCLFRPRQNAETRKAVAAWRPGWREFFHECDTVPRRGGEFLGLSNGGLVGPPSTNQPIFGGDDF